MKIDIKTIGLLTHDLKGPVGNISMFTQLLTGSIEEETTQVMKNLSAVLSQAGGDWENVVKVSIFLTDMADFAAVNKIYGSYISEKRRSTIDASRAMGSTPFLKQLLKKQLQVLIINYHIFQSPYQYS